MIGLTDKDGLHHQFSINHVKMIEFTKTSVRIIWRDARQEDITIKGCKQVVFE